jgi:MFS family permease
MLIAMAILAFSSLGAAKCTTFEGLLIARFCQGFGGSAADTISPDMVGEVFFVHQGGRGVAVYTTLLALGSIVGGVSGGNIAAVYGWPGVFWVSFIMNGIIFLSGIFLMPETMFDRKSRLAVEANFHSEQADSSSNDKGEVKVVETTAGSGSAIAYPPFTFMQSLQMGTYRGNLLGLFIAPLKTLRFPGVLLMMSLYGVLVGAIVTVSTMGPQFMAMPPYLWGANAGLIGLGGIGGLCLGAIYTYGVADRVMMILAKRNVSGLAEPETRLPTMLPSIAIGVAGSLMFGFCAEHPAPGRWGGMAVGYGCISFALLQVPSIGFNYVSPQPLKTDRSQINDDIQLIQSYNAVSGDCLLMVTVFRALITFTFTFEAAAWVEHSGAAEPFGIIAMLLGIAGLFVIPQWKYGKRTRLWTAKWLPEKVDH